MRGWLCVTSIVIFITFATRSASCQKDNICQKLLTSFFFNPKGTWVMTKNRKLRLKMSHSKHCLTANFRFFKNPPKVTIFGIFNELLSNQNVNVAHFARNVKWDFFCDVQPPYMPASFRSRKLPLTWPASKDLFRHFCWVCGHQQTVT